MWHLARRAFNHSSGAKRPRHLLGKSVRQIEEDTHPSLIALQFGVTLYGIPSEEFAEVFLMVHRRGLRVRTIEIPEQT